jgi:glucose-6-phosphate isomerase
MNFDKKGEEPVIEELKAVYVEAGQAIIIPPFYGHCSINAGNTHLIFSNIAVVSCPLFYEPIKQKHGLGYYLVDRDGKQELARNGNYRKIPEIAPVSPKQNPSMGIEFGKSVYQEFVKSPKKFDFLLKPAPYLDEILLMTAG